MKKRAILAAFTASAIALLAVLSATAEGELHLRLDKSTPEADQVLTEAPDKIVLDFSQKPELAVSRVAVKTAGEDIELSEAKLNEEDETILWVAFEQPPADGAYTVSWVAASGDGHPIRGEFSFTVSTGR